VYDVVGKIIIWLCAIPLIATLVTGAQALELNDGDIFIDYQKGIDGLYVLRQSKDYAAELIIAGYGTPVYPVDHIRNRVYLRDSKEGFFYINLNEEPLTKKKADFIPEGMAISSVAANGSFLILTKPVSGDIYYEENPIFAEPYNLTGLAPDMLFRYDMASGEINRLTYSYSQKDSWISTDGACLAYRRHLGLGQGECTLIFCRSDGTGKYDLQNYLLKAGIEKDVLYNEEVVFAPRARVNPMGGTVYYAVLRPNVYPREEVWLNPEYYVAALYFEGDELNCTITKKYIELPAGTALTYFYSAFSSPEVIYFKWRDLAGRGGFMRYDVEGRKFDKIPAKGLYSYFMVY
jgi:hypothetical protein